jgi:hypothetical protein
MSSARSVHRKPHMGQSVSNPRSLGANSRDYASCIAIQSRKLCSSVETGSCRLRASDGIQEHSYRELGALYVIMTPPSKRVFVGLRDTNTLRVSQLVSYSKSCSQTEPQSRLIQRYRYRFVFRRC